MKNLYSILFLFLILISCSSITLAQKENSIKKEISQDVINKIYQILSAQDKKIESALMEDHKNYMAMKKDIEEISKIKDEKSKENAISEYKKKYATKYSIALKKAKVDFEAIEYEIKRNYPGLPLIYDPNSITFTIEENYDNSSSNTNINTNTNNNTIPVSNFKESKNILCGLGAGGDVKHSSNTLEVTSVSALAGLCINKGSKNFEFTVPNDARAAKLTLKAKIHLKGFAIGAVGVAQTSNNAYCGVNIIGFDGFGHSVTTFAPFLWVASNNTDKERTFIKEYTRGTTFDIEIFAQSISTSALCCGTNGMAKVINIDAKIELIK